MAANVRRYNRDRIFRGGSAKGSSEVLRIIRQRVNSGNMLLRTYVTKENERLDKLAARFLGDSKMWWAIAACSGIGWNLQVPPGITLKIPRVNDIKGITG